MGFVVNSISALNISSTGAATFSSSVTAQSGTFSATTGTVLNVVSTNAATDNILLVRGDNGNNVGITVKGTGNVGIGTTSPNGKLDIRDAGTTIPALGQTGTGLNIRRTDGVLGLMIGYENTLGGSYIQSQHMNSSATAYSLLLQPNGGNVGIGTTSPTALLTIQRGASGDNMELIGSGDLGYSDILFYNTSKAARLGYIDWSNTQVRFNVEANIPLAFHTNGSPRLTIASTGGATFSSSVTANGIQVTGTNYLGVGSLRFSANALTLYGGTSGVNINKSDNSAVLFSMTDTGAATFSGSVSKGSGAFKINHPLPSLTDTNYLVHSFIEGPRVDLIYRGKVVLVNGEAQVNIDEISMMTNGTFEALCREVQCFTTNESGWDLVKGNVIGNILYIESQNEDSTDEISWMVIGERKDKNIMETDWTDDDGKVIVEPLKSVSI
jgi:hypothetical protein